MKALKKIATLFKGLHPILTLDPISGQTKIGLDVAAGSEGATLEQVFEYLKHGLTATSSVKSALVRMLDEEIIYHSNEGYLVYDRFFGQWLDAKF